ncbi:hypothetical protein HanIR_Chr10g0472141 [Helianthus annuus]|nr:hypothetical protein HanIR_Chr10g0472141 [Helianthus annuus]
MRLLYFHHAPVPAGHGPVVGNGSVSVFSSLPWEVPLRVRAVYFCSFSCIYARISCLFASFVILSSFHPENTKGRQKHSFSNIST